MPKMKQKKKQTQAPTFLTRLVDKFGKKLHTTKPKEILKLLTSSKVDGGAGMSVSDVAERMACSKFTVRDACHTLGVKPIRPGLFSERVRAKGYETTGEFFEAHLGTTFATMARKLKVLPETVIKYHRAWVKSLKIKG